MAKIQTGSSSEEMQKTTQKILELIKQNPETSKSQFAERLWKISDQKMF